MTVGDLKLVSAQLNKIRIYEVVTKVEVYKGIVFTIPAKLEKHEIVKIYSDVLGVIVLNVRLK